MRSFCLGLLAAAAVACQPEPPSRYECRCPAITSYKVEPDGQTPSGISADTSGNAIDMEYLDSETSKLEECLGFSIDRRGFVVKIAPDWYVSPCSGAQLFPCRLTEEYCRKAGVTPDPRCPCACAGAVQPPNVIVLPPDARAYRHEMIHLVGEADHGNPLFERCEH